MVQLSFLAAVAFVWYYLDKEEIDWLPSFLSVIMVFCKYFSFLFPYCRRPAYMSLPACADL